jgi:hypothetical protein
MGGSRPRPAGSGIDVCRVYSACLYLVLPEFSGEVSKEKNAKKELSVGIFSAKASIVDRRRYLP